MSRQTVSDRIAARHGRVTCAVSWCEEPAHRGIGRYCEHHDCVNERTGHPEARTIRKSELRSWQRTARRYIKKNRDHPAIAAGLRWLTELVYARRPHLGRLRVNANSKERLDHWMQHFKDKNVDPLDMLAVIAGMYFMKARNSVAFRGDRHFRHQLVVRLLRVAPPPKVPKYNNGDGGWKYNRITVGVREHLGRRIETTGIGVLALRISTILVAQAQQAAPRDQEPLRGVNVKLPEEVTGDGLRPVAQ